MKYSIKPTQIFLEHAQKLYENEPKVYAKLKRIIDEIELHPRTGSGHPERLKYYKTETWSRQISKKHRLVYEIYDEIVRVILLTAYGHYDDK